MAEKSVPYPLSDVLKRYCNVNGFVARWPQKLMRELVGHTNPQQEEMFRRQLAEAILHHAISPAQYQALTGEDFDSQEDLEKWLCELWVLLYGNRPMLTGDMPK